MNIMEAKTQSLKLAEGRRLRSLYGGLLWALLGLWLTESERLFSPKETLKRAWWGAAFGTQRTPSKSRWVAESDSQQLQ
jgi:hypothetical protein